MGRGCLGVCGSGVGRREAVGAGVVAGGAGWRAGGRRQGAPRGPGAPRSVRSVGGEGAPAASAETASRMVPRDPAWRVSSRASRGPAGTCGEAGVARCGCRSWAGSLHGQTTAVRLQAQCRGGGARRHRGWTGGGAASSAAARRVAEGRGQRAPPAVGWITCHDYLDPSSNPRSRRTEGGGCRHSGQPLW